MEFINKDKDHFKYGINEWTGEPNKPVFYTQEMAKRIREIIEETRLREEAILTVSKIKKPSILAIEDAITPLVIKPIQKPPLVIEEIKNIQMSEDNKPSLQRSPNSTKILRTYISSYIFNSMINS